MLLYQSVRDKTTDICSTLQVEDHVVQPHPFVSPPKWHLGHTTWFFETFCLQKFLNAQSFDPIFSYVFNSYYESQGERIAQSQRGTLSRPSLDDIQNYRRVIDSRMNEAQHEIEKKKPEIKKDWDWCVQLGLHHEQQHQELLFMDIKAILFSQPGKPPHCTDVQRRITEKENSWRSIARGVYDIGYAQHEFYYDNESPRHSVFCEDYQINESLVSNGEYLEFILDGGYQRSELWLSDGWSWVQKNQITSPLYWLKRDEEWCEYTLSGVDLLENERPVMHVNYFEADAYARWKKCRLPTEAEWEVALNGERSSAAWQWTQSSYSPYPGYKPFKEGFAEYNGKFMSGQMILRGGCSWTPEGHYRPTYRNFYYPEQRWQFCGIRLAK